MMRRIRPAMAAVLAACALATMSVPASAAWRDNEWVMAPQIGSYVLPPPMITKCVYNPGVLGLGANVEIHWRLPENSSVYAYDLADVQFQQSQSGVGGLLAPITGFSPSSNTTQNGVNMITRIPTGLLGGLLGLGSGLDITLNIAKGNWVSTYARINASSGLLAGLGSRCDVVG